MECSRFVEVWCLEQLEDDHLWLARPWVWILNSLTKKYYLLLTPEAVAASILVTNRPPVPGEWYSLTAKMAFSCTSPFPNFFLRMFLALMQLNELLLGLLLLTGSVVQYLSWKIDEALLELLMTSLKENLFTRDAKKISNILFWRMTSWCSKLEDHNAYFFSLFILQRTAWCRSCWWEKVWRCTRWKKYFTILALVICLSPACVVLDWESIISSEHRCVWYWHVGYYEVLTLSHRIHRSWACQFRLRPDDTPCSRSVCAKSWL